MTTHVLPWLRRLLPVLVILCVTAVAQASTITIVNLDGVGEGFNDPTAATPVGGNPGTTIGQQRLNVFQEAASVWGALLPSDVTILVNSNFNPLTCTSTSAVLGSCGATNIYRNFTGAPITNTWYCSALADKLYGSDLGGGAGDIAAQFNSSIGNTGCMDGYSWYYGFDHNTTSTQIDLLTVVLHELAHGLGFQTWTNGSTGIQQSGYPDAFSWNIYDSTTGLLWPNETIAQRAASGIVPFKLLWNGEATRFMAPLTLDYGRALLRVNAPAGIAGDMPVGTATFGPALSYPGVTGNVVLAVDGTAPTSDACTALTNAAAMAGNIAIVDRGTCAFTVKVKYCQDAGAIGVIVANNVTGAPPPGMSGTDATITIPAVMVTQTDGATLKAQIASGLNVTLMVDPDLMAGADPEGRVMLYTPNPYASGSSISHFDVSCAPNLLMEPAINDDLTSDVDLTRYAFEDIGWLPHTTDVPGYGPLPSSLALRPSAPNPFTQSTAVRFDLPRAGVAELAVYDVSGRLVRRLIESPLPAGSHVTMWDGTDSNGERVKNGVYFSRLKVNGQALTGRMVMLMK